MDSDPTRQQIRLPIDSTSLAVLRKSLGVVNNLTPEGGIELGTNSLVNGIVSGYIKSRNYVAGSAGWSIKEDGTAEFSSATIRGYVNATSGLIGGWIINATSISDVAGTVGLSSAVTGGDDIRFWAGHATPASAPFKVTEAGVLTATSGTIGGFTLSATEMYGGIIKTAATVGAGSTGVIMDTAGLRGYDSVLGLTFNLPTNGSAPTFASGIINSTIFNINTNAVLRTSATVGDGSINSAGILINNTALYACEANQTLANANVKLLTTGSANFKGAVTATSGTFDGITSASMNVGSTGHILGGQTAYNTGAGFWM
jgi:hypothetical protein